MSELEPEKQKLAIEPPKLHGVKIVNDSYTDAQFVVELLSIVFQLDDETANAKMLEIHNSGSVILGEFTKDVALSKCKQIHTIARKYEFPLRSEAVPL